MATVTTIEQLESLYAAPVESSLMKETDRLASLHRPYIDAARFVVIASAGPEGLDCSPRGDPAGFVRIVDDRTLLLPDRRGNNRIDTLRNLVRDPRIGLLFLTPGIGVTLRVNGTARLRTDEELLAGFAIDGRVPTTVIEIAIERVYTQCPKALVRSDLWNPDGFRDPAELPTVGQINNEISGGAFDGDAYDAAYPERLRQTIY